MSCSLKTGAATTPSKIEITLLQAQSRHTSDEEGSVAGSPSTPIQCGQKPANPLSVGSLSLECDRESLLIDIVTKAATGSPKHSLNWAQMWEAWAG